MSTFDGYFEDFQEGMTFETPRRTITEADIVNFAGVSGDFNPIHVDAVHAAGTMFGQRIAHGLLVLSVASGLCTQLGFLGDTVQAFLGLEWKFKAPVFIGDTLSVRLKVAGLRPLKRLGGGVVTFQVGVVNQKDEVVQTGSWQVLFKSRERQAEQPA